MLGSRVSDLTPALLPHPNTRRVSRGGTYIYTYKEYDPDSRSEVSFEKDIILKPQREEAESHKKRISLGGLRLGSTFKPWAEVSKINFVPSTFFEVLSQAYRRRSRSIAQGAGADPAGARAHTHEARLSVTGSIKDMWAPPAMDQPIELDESHYEKLKQAKNLLNEKHHWGCFYVYPDLYSDEESPVVKIREVGEEPGDVAPLTGGVLSRDIITTCLTYLKRTPLLGAFVYIKLDISHKYLTDIEVLRHYRYLVYLDMNSNLLTNLKVLTHLPYLQFLSVAYNRLGTVLEYENPQWFLTEVIYKYNSVKSISDLTKYWSLSSLDLSHNKIKSITGLENLHYLRRLDLSFNQIRKLENLNHLRLTWLDVSYNHIKSFEYSDNTGLWTLTHLEYLNLNENELSSMKVLYRCSRLRELHARNNRFTRLLDMAVYLKQLRRLLVLDLRANGVCSQPGYKEVVVHIFPTLLNLDQLEIDPVEQRTARMEMQPDLMVFATRRLLRLLYVEQLSRSRVYFTTPPADTMEVPIVALVGCEACGKGGLMRRLVKECASMVEPARVHTTSIFHYPDNYVETSRAKFDDMILNGQFLTYSEMYGQSYGLSRQEGWITGKVKITILDLAGALMLALRGRRPYLILVYNNDKEALVKRQEERKRIRNQVVAEAQRKSYVGVPLDKNTLQVMVSGRLLVNGIINELMNKISGGPAHDTTFVMESECSLFQDSKTRETAEAYTQAIRLSNFLDNNLSSSGFSCSQDQAENMSPLFERERESDVCSTTVPARRTSQKQERRVSLDTNIHMGQSRKNKQPFESSYQSSENDERSVSFSEEHGLSLAPAISSYEEPDVSSTQMGECSCWDVGDNSLGERKDSRTESQEPTPSIASAADSNDQDLWPAVLADIQNSLLREAAYAGKQISMKTLFEEFGFRKIPKKSEKLTDFYEEIHQEHPGLFKDTVPMDDPEAAFCKMKNILRNIVESQKLLKPMFNIDFLNNTKDYPHIGERLEDIYKQIAPQRLFN